MLKCNLQNRTFNSPVIKIITNSKFKYKESEKVIDVCQAIQDMLKETELKKSKEVAKNFHEMGITVENIAQGVGYPLDTVKKWL